MSWWPYVTAAAIGAVGLALAASTFVTAHTAGWNDVRGALLFFQGMIFASAICNAVFVFHIRRMGRVFREKIHEAYQQIPAIVTKIMQRLQADGLVHPEIEFSEMIVSDEDGPKPPPGSKLN